MIEPTIIQFCGPKGCGKSTIAVHVAEILNLPIVSAAATLKKMIAVLLQEYGFNDEKIKYYITNPIGKEEVIPEIGVTPRFMMETIGTNWGRQTIHPNLWSNIARHQLEQGGIADDTRFPQEVVPGSILIEVVRPGVKYNPDIPSEAGLSQSIPRALVLHNTGTVNEAVQEVLKVVNG